MTTTSQLITDAFRQSNLLPIGVAPTALQTEEALRYLNRLLKSVFGAEVGEPLQAFPIGSDNISRPSGYPWWNTTPDNDWFVPKNIRVMLNVDSPGISLYLHPDPDDGSRFAAIDVSETLSTYPVTVYGNGRRIEGDLSLALNTDGYDAEWFYRGDLGNWVKYAPLQEEDTFPFPEEFDDFFITRLAIRLNPSYGAALDPQSQDVLSRSQRQLKARYSQEITQRSELGLIRPAKVAVDRDRWGNEYTFYNPNSMFIKGWPF